jgi:hypothetical protein
MRLQIPVGFVIGLPDAAEIGFAAHASDARGRSRRLTRRRRDRRRNDGADSSRGNCDHYHRT